MPETVYTLPIVIVGVIGAVILVGLKIACYRRSIFTKCCQTKRRIVTTTCTTGNGRPVVIFPQGGRTGRTRSGSILYVPYRPPRSNRHQSNHDHHHRRTDVAIADIRRPISENIHINAPVHTPIVPSAPPCNPPNYDQVVDSSLPTYTSVMAATNTDPSSRNNLPYAY